MTPELTQCRTEQRAALARLQEPSLTGMERFLAGLWLQDWVKEELLLMAEVKPIAPTREQEEQWAEALRNAPPGDMYRGTRHDPVQLRLFDTGATRDTDTNKLDYEGFLSPAVLQRYARYMHRNRVQTDGALRDSDNWTKGIPRRQYMKSLWRHVFDVWLVLRGRPELAVSPDLEESLCASMFNTMGLLHEVLTGRDVGATKA